jgi:UDP-N-acetylglucosamine--N-acetylmuramyl-(pentapeptide) pyrophosphoryl-undecaprenol N-acetylglucosamine transferase
MHTCQDDAHNYKKSQIIIMDKLKVILSGGGTGGHIYPAVAVAEALKRRLGDGVELLFVGAEGKMEMEKVPALGYRIEGLPVVGLQRRLTLRNLQVPFKVAESLRKARRVIREFGADVVVGFGGYASAPVLWSAQRMGIPTLIQEQNSYAGVTNKILASRAKRICVAYEGMERFFPKDRIVMTGNPLRGRLLEQHDPAVLKTEGLTYFGLTADKPIVLVVGGSLGTRTLNNMMKANVDRITSEGKVQVIWQTGKFYEREMTEFMQSRSSEGIWRGAFIDRMDLAYAVADVVVGRSGAGTVSELCLVGKPAIFVPSPNVAEDHQTKNAMALVRKDAALLVPDSEAVTALFPVVDQLLADPARMQRMAANIKALGIADSADRIVDELLAVVQAQKK